MEPKYIPKSVSLTLSREQKAQSTLNPIGPLASYGQITHD